MNSGSKIAVVSDHDAGISSRANVRNDSLARFWIGLAVAALLVCSGMRRKAIASQLQDQVCDVSADYALGVEDYPEAIRLHQGVLRRHPDDALAHYHLGFAEGMMSESTLEITEYRRAAALGLTSWDLFFNLGLAQFENGDLDGATKSLRRAVHFGEGHFEAHFNLALVDERRGMLAEAEAETLAALRLSPGEIDARNLQGVIDARQGQPARASEIFRQILQEQPDYQPARDNLLILEASRQVRAVTLRGTGLKTISNERKPSVAGIRNAASAKIGQ
jgi:tetratricopeptide (TPR) repeat protein